MGLGNIYNRIALTSPYVEVMLRQLYWKNVKRLAKYKPDNHTVSIGVVSPPLDFEKVKDWLQSQGVQDGTLMIVHSSYDTLAGSGLKPNEIVHELRELVGEHGTLAMPAIRQYKELPPSAEWLKTDFSRIVCRYDPRRTPVSSGLLPAMLMREKGAVISMHPLNTMVAVGPLSEEMMAHNLDGDRPSPHGPNSSWKYCLDHDAVVVALGVPMIHHMTIAHVKDEAFGEPPFDNWYNDLQFDIVMPDKTVLRKIVKDRNPKWGMLHDAEMNFGKDLERVGIMHLTEIDGVQIGFLRSKDLIDFMRSRKHKAYPYYKFF